MENKLAAYFELKQRQRELEAQLAELRDELIGWFDEPIQTTYGGYHLRISLQERREYDDHLLYNRLPDGALWRMMSKADPAKIAGLVKLNVVSEDLLEGTYKIKRIPYVYVNKL
ncbi:hypothetical protein [Paenibacillus senegalensis]|uniref:hypothetical protein n=1 Tax=Paenibacillus senegalensis TaxID=1465766 RepID=UPI0003056C31|nr:hypothetical protein [Paenibacillus senegalensis]